MPDPEKPEPMKTKVNDHYTVTVLPGDGVGPEVTAAALHVLLSAADVGGFTVEVDFRDFGGIAIDRHGTPLPDATREACLAADAVFLGAVGGPKWDDAPERPEKGLLGLRKTLGVFANVRPVSVPRQLVSRSPLRTQIAAGTDMVIVRELTGGVYFGEPSGVAVEDGRRVGVSTMRYDEEEIVRVARVAFEMARKRNGRVTSVDKANVLAASMLWREVVTELHAGEFDDVDLDHLYVDNAAMQLVRRPRDFDVVLTGNLFGDILSDLAATIPGSLGMLPSASLGGRAGLFEPVHGSAPDIAGTGKANPAAAILSMAMMLDALGHTESGASVRRATMQTIAGDVRTPDLGGTATTEAVGAAVSELLFSEKARVAA